jgi:hypothetical protein
MIKLNKIEIKIIKEADEKSIVELYKDAGWWDDSYNSSFIADMINGSFCFAGAFIDGKMIGMGRAISDGVSDAYIQEFSTKRDRQRNNQHNSPTTPGSRSRLDSPYRRAGNRKLLFRTGL